MKSADMSRNNGKSFDLLIVDELSHITRVEEAIHTTMDEAIRDGKVIVIDNMSMGLTALEQRINDRHIKLEMLKAHALAKPEKQYGKKYRRLLRSGKR